MKGRWIVKIIFMFVLATFLSVTPMTSQAVTLTTVNVADFCPVVDGTVDNTACIQSAINSSQLANGGTVHFPCGQYKTTNSIVLPASGLVSLEGEGRCSSLNGYGNFSTVVENGGYGGSIKNIRFAEYNKTGGYTFDLSHISQFLISDVFIDAPYCGPHLHDFNDVVVSRARIYNVSGNGCQAFYLTGGGPGDSNGRSDVIDFQDVVFSGRSSERTNAHHGLIVDGFVNTVSAHKIYFTAIDGHGLWIRNAIGASQSPQFLSFYGLESDFDYDSAIFLQSGSVFHFTDTQVHGTLSSKNIDVAPGVNRVSFQGGFSTGANQAGIDSYGTDVSISNMDISGNSNPNSGGTPGLYPGIKLQNTSRRVTITGVKAGTPSNPSWQKYGIEIVSGADQYSITGNSLANNNLGAVAGASGTSTKVIANNSQ